MQTNDLFEQITSAERWFDKCKFIGSKNYADLIIRRHRAGELAFNMYTKIFTAYGYKKNLIWEVER